MKELRFSVSDAVKYGRSVGDGKKGGSMGAGFMKQMGLQQTLEDRWNLVRYLVGTDGMRGHSKLALQQDQNIWTGKATICLRTDWLEERVHNGSGEK